MDVRPNTVIDVVKGDANTVPYKDSASPEFGYIEGRSNEKQPIELNELADVGHSIWNRCNELLLIGMTIPEIHKNRTTF